METLFNRMKLEFDRSTVLPADNTYSSQVDNTYRARVDNTNYLRVDHTTGPLVDNITKVSRFLLLVRPLKNNWE